MPFHLAFAPVNTGNHQKWEHREAVSAFFLLDCSLGRSLLVLLVMYVIGLKNDRWDEGAIHRSYWPNQQFLVLPLSRRLEISFSNQVTVNMSFTTSSVETFSVFQMTSSMLIFQCVFFFFFLQLCAIVCVPGSVELRNRFDLPSAPLMHANLLLASQENNYSHTTNKVQTPSTQSRGVLTVRDSSNGTGAWKSPAERGSNLQMSRWKSIVEKIVHKTVLLDLIFNSQEPYKDVRTHCFHFESNLTFLHLNTLGFSSHEG